MRRARRFRQMRAAVFALVCAPLARAISLPAVPLKATRMATFGVSKFSVAYGKLCEDHFVLMAAAQSSVLRGAADLLGQGVQHGAAPEHALAMATVGGLVSGMGGALWLRVLENHYGTSVAPDVVLRKTATDYLCWAPLANSAYLYGLPLLTGCGHEAALLSLQHGFLSVMAMEMAIFMPYNLIAFEHVPVAIRPLTSAALAALFTIGVGMLA